MTLLVCARENERLAALQSLAIFETEPEPQFDAICRGACSFFQVPIAYIAFIDKGRQWLKAACGMSLSSVPREGTFCSRTILLDRVLVVQDASSDPRFAKNPYVLGAPHIRFYAGAPLTLMHGMRVGTLCLIDIVPREFPDERAEALRDLAECVVQQLQIRAQQRNGGGRSAVKTIVGGLDEMGQATSFPI